VARIAKEAGASLVLDSDAHEPDDLLTPEFSLRVAKGAGLDDDEIHALLQLNPRNLLEKLGFGSELAAQSD
jgi:histidinol phosphatase-like PHP family hydrolase